MTFQLNENQEMCRDLARDFAEKQCRPRIEEFEKNNSCPKDIYKLMGDIGLLGIVYDEKYGGMELGHDCYALVVEELSKAAVCVPAALRANNMFCEAINMFGTEEQKEQFIPKHIAGDSCGSFAFTEPGTGSDPKQLTSTYREEGDFYILNGTKRFITNAGYEGMVLVFAKDEKTGDLSAFAFDKFCEGYSLSNAWEMMGYIGSPVYDIFMDNIRVPKANLIGGVGNGFKVLKNLIAFSKLGLSASYVGNMERAYELAVKYAKEKIHRDKAISKFPTIQTRIADIAAKCEASKYLVYHLAEMSDDISKRDAVLAQSALVKAYVSDTSVDVCHSALAVMGAYGPAKEYEVERCMRDAAQSTQIEGVVDMQRIIFGRWKLFSE